MRTTAHGRTVHFEVAGEGPPVVLIPGLLMSAQRWIDTGYVGALCEVATVIAVDPLGHGHSDQPLDAEVYALPDAGVDLVAVLDELGIERAAWWGYSRGAHLAAAVAATCPDRVTALVAGGASVTRGVEILAPGAAALAAPLRRGDWNGFWELMPVPEPVQRMMERSNDPLVVAAVIEGLRPGGFDPASIRCPTLVYSGGADMWATTLDEDAVALGAEAHLLDGLDHAGAFASSGTILPLVATFLGLPTPAATAG